MDLKGHSAEFIVLTYKNYYYDKKCLEEKEMDRLVGGNECAFGTANQWANYYSGKCSCICGGSGEDAYYNVISDVAKFTKSNGTVLPNK